MRAAVSSLMQRSTPVPPPLLPTKLTVAAQNKTLITSGTTEYCAKTVFKV